jgi:type II secretory pathway pseudopilin PulG
MTLHPRTQRRAFTLIEAAISTLIVGVMVAAALSVVGTAARGAAREREWRQSQALAASLMAEVLSMSFRDPQGGNTFGFEGDETPGTRATFDDLDDFDGYKESPATDAAGVTLTWSTGWSREAVVENVSPADVTKAEADSENTGLRRVIVTVISPAGKVRRLVALKSSASVVDAFAPVVGVDRITGVRIGLRVGSSGSALIGGATMYNAPATTLAAAPEPDAKKLDPEVAAVPAK